MAHNLKKFKQMEKEPISPPPLVAKPKRKKEMNIFGHIAKQFENPEGAKEQRKRALEERKEALRREKEYKEQEARDKKQREVQEAEERKRRHEEEEERIRIEEEKKRLAEDAEKKRLERQKIREEEELNSKTSRLKPAQERFEACRNLRMRVSKPVTSERIVVNAGAISELRGKLFQNKKSNEIEFQKKTRPPSRKLIVPPNKIEDSKPTEHTEKKLYSCNPTTEQMLSNDTNEDERKQEKDTADAKKSDNDIKNVLKEETGQLETIRTTTSRRGSKNEEHRGSKVSLNKEGSKSVKRQSFISDFASLEKTYKLLGISRDKNPPPDNPPKIRHKSAEKVKTKDKAKKHKSLNIEQELATTVNKELPKLEEKIPINKPVINILEKGQSANLRNFFQGVISEKKNKTPVELMGPQKIKRSSFQNIFEKQTSTTNSTIERQVDRVGAIDKKKFETFLDKFEPQQQREIAKLKVAQITAQQKALEKQKREAEEKKICKG